MTLILQRQPFFCGTLVKRPKFLFQTTKEFDESCFEGSVELLWPWINDCDSRLARKNARSNSWSWSLFMPGYSPEEIHVKTQDGSVIVSATHEEDDGVNMDRREFKRTIRLPDDVDSQSVKTSYADKNGTLTIHAPVKRVENQLGENGHFAHLQSFIDEGNDKVLKMTLPGFSPGDIDVKVKDSMLEIHAKQGDDHGYRETFNRIRLPSDVDVERISSKCTKDGVLKVKAPKVIPVELQINSEEKKNEYNTEETSNDD